MHERKTITITAVFFQLFVCLLHSSPLTSPADSFVAVRHAPVSKLLHTSRPCAFLADSRGPCRATIRAHAGAALDIQQRLGVTATGNSHCLPHVAGWHWASQRLAVSRLGVVRHRGARSRRGRGRLRRQSGDARADRWLARGRGARGARGSPESASSEKPRAGE